MDTAAVIERFKATGALLEGHYVLTSGLHSPNYLQCALLLQHPREAEKFARALAAHFQDDNIELVASPAIGGIIIGHEVARQLGARFIWTERVDGQDDDPARLFCKPDERTLVVEDVITTGGSTLETVETLTEAGANVLGAASIIDRSSGRADVGVARVALATLDVPAVDPAFCDLCRRGIPVVKPGSRKL